MRALVVFAALLLCPGCMAKPQPQVKAVTHSLTLPMPKFQPNVVSPFTNKVVIMNYHIAAIFPTNIPKATNYLMAVQMKTNAAGPWVDMIYIPCNGQSSVGLAISNLHIPNAVFRTKTFAGSASGLKLVAH